MAKARGKHYQLACAIAFEGITGAPHDAGINRPSDYYAAAVEAATAGAAAAAAVAGGGAKGAGATPGRGLLGENGAPPATPGAALAARAVAGAAATPVATP